MPITNCKFPIDSTGTSTRRFLLTLILLGLFGAHSQINAEVAFNRIIHGWTNYSSAFLATHDNGSGDYATVAAYYTPTQAVCATEFSVIVVSDLPPEQRVDFNRFNFVIGIWSSLQSFTNSPAGADVIAFAFTSPTGGPPGAPDAITRGGRPAYELRFSITNRSVILSEGHTYLVGFFARTAATGSGLLYVPTSNHPGESDVQAGNTIIGGWLNIADTGGSTIYDGELAIKVTVDPALPTLSVVRLGNCIELAWPAKYEGFRLETADLLPAESWQEVLKTPTIVSGSNVVHVPPTASLAVFRLRK